MEYNKYVDSSFYRIPIDIVHFNNVHPIVAGLINKKKNLIDMNKYNLNYL